MNNNQRQKSGDDSVNFQANSIIINNGVTHSDLEQKIMDLREKDFPRLRDEAAEIATERVKHFVGKFCKKLIETNNQELVNRLSDPDIHYNFIVAQTEYARSGDKNTEELLINILLSRICEQERELKKIVLNESLSIVPKITKSQISVLSLVFLINHVKFNNVDNMDKLIEMFNKFHFPLLSHIEVKRSDYQHLAFTRCANFSRVGAGGVLSSILRNYTDLFCKGFTLEQVAAINGEAKIDDILMPCLNDPSLFQIKAIDESVIKSMCNKINFNEEETNKIINLQKSSLMNEVEAKQFLESKSENMGKLFSLYPLH